MTQPLTRRHRRSKFKLWSLIYCYEFLEYLGAVHVIVKSLQLTESVSDRNRVSNLYFSHYTWHKSWAYYRYSLARWSLSCLPFLFFHSRTNTLISHVEDGLTSRNMFVKHRHNNHKHLGRFYFVQMHKINNWEILFIFENFRNELFYFFTLELPVLWSGICANLLLIIAFFLRNRSIWLGSVVANTKIDIRKNNSDIFFCNFTIRVKVKNSESKLHFLIKWSNKDSYKTVNKLFCVKLFASICISNIKEPTCHNFWKIF